MNLAFKDAIQLERKAWRKMSATLRQMVNEV